MVSAEKYLEVKFPSGQRDIWAYIDPVILKQDLESVYRGRLGEAELIAATEDLASQAPMWEDPIYHRWEEHNALRSSFLLGTIERVVDDPTSN